MVVNNAALACAAVGKKGFPVTGLPEIAFAGRSNVGKSSLINAMLGRHALARSSQNPGKTRTINFYIVENKMYFVDLPGYGYAKLGRAEIARIGRMTENYLTKRFTLKCIVLIVDIRREPSENDLTMLAYLRHYGYRIIIAATKADKLKRSEVSKHCEMIKSAFALSETETLIPFSSETKAGVPELWDALIAA